MKKPLTFSSWGRQLKKLFLLWLLLAVVAGAVVVGGHFLTLPARSSVTATVNFSFEGMEQGRDPNGNWFDPDAMKDPEVITAAAAEAGIPLEEGGAERIASRLYIEGVIPDNVISRITSLSSAFSSDKVPVSTMRKIRAYYPTTYQLRLDLGALGLTREQGNRLLPAVLEAYRKAFLSRYGYNPAFENAVLNEDYAAYDYDDAVALLRENLSTLETFASSLAARDKSGYRSAETGLTLADVTQGLASLRKKDIARLSDYISAHSVARDPALEKDTLAWRLEEQQRVEAELRERVESMDALLASYNKTRTLVLAPVTADAAEAEAPAAPETPAASAASAGQPANTASGMASYEITKPSVTFDYLVSRRQKLEEEREAAAAEALRLSARLALLEGGVQETANAYADAEFSRILERLRTLIATLRATAEEYDRSARLEAGFSVVELTKAQSFPFLTLISASLADGIAVEALLLGLYLLFAAWRAGRSGGRPRKARRPAGETA